jgi:hypothetical protein
MQMTTDLKTLAAGYVEAAGCHDYDAVLRYLADGISFRGPLSASTGTADFIAGLKRMAPIWVRNDVREVLVNGHRACVIYDFVTNTPVGTLTCAEVLSFDGDRITSVELFFDAAQLQK